MAKYISIQTHQHIIHIFVSDNVRCPRSITHTAFTQNAFLLTFCHRHFALFMHLTRSFTFQNHKCVLGNILPVCRRTFSENFSRNVKCKVHLLPQYNTLHEILMVVLHVIVSLKKIRGYFHQFFLYVLLGFSVEAEASGWVNRSELCCSTWSRRSHLLHRHVARLLFHSVLVT